MRWFAPAAGGRLTLSNFTFDLADVEAIVTPYADCAVHPGLVPLDFKLPMNATWLIPATAGADVCWRRALPLDAAHPGLATGKGWTQWNRVFTSSGRAIDARL